MLDNWAPYNLVPWFSSLGFKIICSHAIDIYVPQFIYHVLLSISLKSCAWQLADLLLLSNCIRWLEFFSSTIFGWLLNLCYKGALVPLGHILVGMEQAHVKGQQALTKITSCCHKWVGNCVITTLVSCNMVPLVFNTGIKGILHFLQLISVCMNIS